MKIKINKDEAYILKIPDEIEGTQIYEIILKLQKVSKLVGKDPFVSCDQIPKKFRSSRGIKPWFNSRIEGIVFLKMYYTATRDEKNIYAEGVGVSYYVIKNDIRIVRDKWNIQPTEIGLIKFPTAGNKIERLPASTHIQNGTKNEAEKTVKEETPLA